MTRASTEIAMEHEADVLGRIAMLLQRGVPFAQWTRFDREAVRMALHEPSQNRMEAQKARTLWRHLFRTTSVEQMEIGTTAENNRIAERLRSDLLGIVPLGAGLMCGGATALLHAPSN